MGTSLKLSFIFHRFYFLNLSVYESFCWKWFANCHVLEIIHSVSQKRLDYAVLGCSFA